MSVSLSHRRPAPSQRVGVTPRAQSDQVLRSGPSIHWSREPLTGRDIAIVRGATWADQPPDLALAFFEGWNAGVTSDEMARLSGVSVEKIRRILVWARRRGIALRKRGGENLRSSFRGVTYAPSSGRWGAELRVDGARLTKNCADEQEAICARLEMEMQIFGRHLEPARIVVEGAEARVPLIDKLGEPVAWARIDAADVELVGRHSWSVIPAGYAVAKVKNRNLYMHRLVLGEGASMGDHVSGDKLDNRRCNLRPCTKAQNNYNTRPRSGLLPGIKGVTVRANGRFGARISHKGEYHWLGTFDTVDEAARAYDAAARQKFGEFARLNSSDERGAA